MKDWLNTDDLPEFFREIFDGKPVKGYEPKSPHEKAAQICRQIDEALKRIKDGGNDDGLDNRAD